eukprot:763044-Rhodomonas_salina.1
MRSEYIAALNDQTVICIPKVWDISPDWDAGFPGGENARVSLLEFDDAGRADIFIDPTAPPDDSVRVVSINKRPAFEGSFVEADEGRLHVIHGWATDIFAGSTWEGLEATE